MDINSKLEEILTKLNEIQMSDQNTINLLPKTETKSNEKIIWNLRSDVITLRYDVATLKGKVGKLEMRLEKLEKNQISQ